MKWLKKGIIFKAEGQYEFLNSYTTPITAVNLSDKIRVYFSSRALPDQNGNFVSYPTYIDLNPDNLSEIIYIHNKPILPLGEAGTFDEFGIMVYKALQYNNKIYLYYGGWQRLASSKAPYQVLLGLAVSCDNGNTFEKVSSGPVMGLDIYDPLSIGNEFIIIQNNTWHMFYTSYTEWNFAGSKPTPHYHLKYATSHDGIKWERTGKIVLDDDGKGGLATPTILKLKDKYIMLFGYRQPYDINGNPGSYRIGYAESEDLLNWKRDDSQSGIDVSESGWDSEMVCYPDIIQINNKTIMFYCGNGFGRDGFGYAELVK